MRKASHFGGIAYTLIQRRRIFSSEHLQPLKAMATCHAGQSMPQSCTMEALKGAK